MKVETPPLLMSPLILATLVSALGIGTAITVSSSH